jgi:heme A synthase
MIEDGNKLVDTEADLSSLFWTLSGDRGTYNADSVEEVSMWPHRDLGWWGFVISLMALLGAYPLSLLANLTSPALKNWWAERSIASTRKRIDKLEKQLAEYMKDPALTEGEDYILRATEALSMLLALCVTMLAVLLMSLAWFAPVTVSNHDKEPLVALALVGAVCAFLIGIVVFGRFSRFRRKRSPIDRNYLNKYIEELKKKLDQKTRV